MNILEDGVWRYYNCPDRFWSEKCQSCRAKVAAERAPVRECIDLVVRTGLPLDAYPEGPTAYLLMLYAKDISEREALRDGAESYLFSLSCDLTGRREPTSSLASGFSRSKRLPVRRGCWRFDDILGPWQSWYPEDRDYGK